MLHYIHNLPESVWSTGLQNGYKFPSIMNFEQKKITNRLMISSERSVLHEWNRFCTILLSKLFTGNILFIFDRKRSVQSAHNKWSQIALHSSCIHIFGYASVINRAWNKNKQFNERAHLSSEYMLKTKYTTKNVAYASATWLIR